MSRILKLAGVFGGSLLLAGLVHFTRTDDGYTEGGSPYYRGFSPREISLYGERIRDILVRDEMRNLSEKMAKVSVREPEIVRPYVEGEGYSIGEWSRTCKRCEWLGSEEARRLRRIAEDFGVGEVAYGLPDAESNFNHFDKEGNPIESKKGAVGKLQLLGNMGSGKNGEKREVGGFDEVYAICNNPTKGHASFLIAYGYYIGKWGMPLRGEEDEVWSNIMHSEVANEIAGYMYLGYLKHKSGGDIDAALQIYNAGMNGKAIEYRDAVLARQAEWEDLEKNVCPKINEIMFCIEDKLAERYFYSLLDDKDQQEQFQVGCSAEPGETYKSPAALFYPCGGDRSAMCPPAERVRGVQQGAATGQPSRKIPPSAYPFL